MGGSPSAGEGESERASLAVRPAASPQRSMGVAQVGSVWVETKQTPVKQSTELALLFAQWRLGNGDHVHSPAPGSGRALSSEMRSWLL